MEDLLSVLANNKESCKKIYRIEFVKQYSRGVLELLPNLKAIEWKDCKKFSIFIHSKVTHEGSKLLPHFPQGITKLYLENLNLQRDTWNFIPEGLTTLLLESIDCIEYDNDLEFLTRLPNLQKLQGKYNAILSNF